MTADEAGLDVWEAALARYLEEHVRIESVMLERYRDLAGQTSASFVGFLVELLIEDEERHHRLFTTMVNSLRPTTPDDDRPWVPPVMNVVHPEALLGATEELLAAEQDDAVELKRLAKSLRRSTRRSLWPLLVDAMQRDTAKHEAILRFLRDRLREQVDTTPTR